MIEIDIGTNLFSTAQFMLSWHGLYSFLAVASAVILVGRWAPMRGIRSDDIYSIATYGITAGVIGARLVHVMDEWDFYSNDPGKILQVWSGGIGVWGGILGGFIGAVAATVLMNMVRSRRREQLEQNIKLAKTDEERQEANAKLELNQHLPVGVIAGLTAPAMLFVQSIGRIGDLVNGEHCSRATDLFWAFKWTNPDSAARYCDFVGSGVGVGVHPAIAYEIIWNMVALCVVWKFRRNLVPTGMVWALYLALYAVGRFTVSFWRMDDVWALGMQEAHYISLAVLTITLPVLLWKARIVMNNGSSLEFAGYLKTGTRAQRRRRSKH